MERPCNVTERFPILQEGIGIIVDGETTSLEYGIQVDKYLIVPFAYASHLSQNHIFGVTYTEAEYA